MSREIKFRAWCIPEKCMYDVMTVENLAGGTKVLGTGIFIGNGWASINDNFKDKLEKQVELMQYTGIKDQNGKEIYEGDIISYWNGTMSACSKNDKDAVNYPNTAPHFFKLTKNKHAAIVYKAPSFKVEGGNALGSMNLTTPDIEIIGNIYENPELLEHSNEP